MKQPFIILAKVTTSILICASLSNCIIVGTTKNEPTTGQKLIDIKSAYDKGIITKSQYDQQKAAIIAEKSAAD